MSRRHILFAIPLIAVFLADPAAAQRRQGSPPGAGPGMTERGPLQMAPSLQGFAPEHLLASSDALQLTSEQQDRLETLRREIETQIDQAQARHGVHRTALRELLASVEPDPLLVRTHFEGAHAAMGRVHWLALEAALEARAILTPEQRNRVYETGPPPAHRGGPRR